MNRLEESGPSPDADLAALMARLAGEPLDPEIYRRVRERAERITEELRKTHGEMSIAVDLIRDARDDA